MEIGSLNNSNTSLLQKPTENKEALTLNKGDIVAAQIVSVDGETVTLKTAEDLLLTGKLMSELELAVGQDAEFEVIGTDGGKYILKASTANMDSVELSAQKAPMQASDKLAAKVSALLNNIGVEADSGVVSDIMDAVSQNPKLSIKTAVFMAANEIAFTEENIDAVNLFESEENQISNKLLDILGQVVADKFFPGAETAAKASQTQPQTAAAGEQVQQTVQNAAAQSGAEGTQSTAAANTAGTEARFTALADMLSDITAEAKPENISSAQPADASVEADQSSQAQANAAPQETSSQVKSIINSFLSGEIQLGDAAANENVSGEAAVSNAAETAQAGGQSELQESAAALVNNSDAAEDKSFQSLVAKVVTLFSQMEDIKSGKAKIENNNTENAQKLSELKQTVQSSDIKNRELLEAKTDEMISQNKIMSDVKRFSYFTLPLNMGQQQQTAEIFVYKRNGGRKTKNSADTSVLIGLDTQNIGRFEVLLKASGDNLSINMYRDDPTGNEVIEIRTKQLRQALDEIGYNLSSFTIEKLAEKTTLANAEQVLTGSASSSSRVDFRA